MYMLYNINMLIGAVMRQLNRGDWIEVECGTGWSAAYTIIVG